MEVRKPPRPYHHDAAVLHREGRHDIPSFPHSTLGNQSSAQAPPSPCIIPNNEIFLRPAHMVATMAFLYKRLFSLLYVMFYYWYPGGSKFNRKVFVPWVHYFISWWPGVWRRVWTALKRLKLILHCDCIKVWIASMRPRIHSLQWVGNHTKNKNPKPRRRSWGCVRVPSSVNFCIFKRRKFSFN